MQVYKHANYSVSEYRHIAQRWR